jgi:hypothetical protein
MGEFVRAAYHVAQFLFGAGAIGTAIRWLSKRRQKELEDRVLDTFHNADGPWHCADSVVGEMNWKGALNDAPGFFRPKLSGWREFRSRLRVSPYRLRFALRRAFVVPSKRKTEQILRDLWERHLLVRADWDHTDKQFYKLKT